MPPVNPVSPFDVLPPVYSPNRTERRLAKQYEAGDFSGGYLTSQIAHFRMPKRLSHHWTRRANAKRLKRRCEKANRELPGNLVTLLHRNDYNNRIRHNTIWLRPVPALTPLPTTPDWLLAQLFYECQGCGFWFIAFGPGNQHTMVYCNDSLGTEGEYPQGPPDLTTFRFYQCSETLDDWLTYYFLDCQNHDKRYEEHIVQYAGM